MNPLLKTCLIAVGAAAIFFGVDAIWTKASGESSGLAEGVVIAVIVFFAVRIGYKSDDRRPGMPESPDDSQTSAPFLKTCLIAAGAAVVFFGVDAIWTRASGEPSGLAEGVVIAVIVFFAVRIGYKSDDRRPGMPESPDDSQTPAP